MDSDSRVVAYENPIEAYESMVSMASLTYFV